MTPISPEKRANFELNFRIKLRMCLWPVSDRLIGAGLCVCVTLTGAERDRKPEQGPLPLNFISPLTELSLPACLSVNQSVSQSVS